jgi:hypothetical protein
MQPRNRLSVALESLKWVVPWRSLVDAVRARLRFWAGRLGSRTGGTRVACIRMFGSFSVENVMTQWMTLIQ